MARRRVNNLIFEEPTKKDVSRALQDDPAMSAGRSDAELAASALLREARAARNNLSLFYGFVMRHEITKERVVTAPHQHLAISFLMAHPLSVLRIPVGTGKTYLMSATALWQLGNDVTRRQAFVSKTQGQASKPVQMIADYITEPYLSNGLTLVFPWLMRSSRAQDPWTQTQLTIERPPGIRDASLMAYGLDMNTPGSRWFSFVADDLIDDENSMTTMAREKTVSKFNARLWSRLDPMGSRAVTTNTPWDRHDLTYHLENVAYWPTLTMDIYGYIRVSNASAAWINTATKMLIRCSRTRHGEGNMTWYRLRAHDPDPDEQIPLWPARYNMDKISELRYGTEGKGGMLPHEFARLFMCEPMDVGATRCQPDWIERCKQLGMGMTLVSKYDGPNPTFTGCDLGIGPNRGHDPTVLVTFERQPDGRRVILDVDSGRWNGLLVVDKLIEKRDRYGSVSRVETNAAQDYIRQFALAKRKDLLIQAHATTVANKFDKDFGVESLFSELQNQAWVIPCDYEGRCHPEVQKLIDDCIYYQPPPAHTGNHLMALWLGREASRRGYGMSTGAGVGRPRGLVAAGGF